MRTFLFLCVHILGLSLCLAQAQELAFNKLESTADFEVFQVHNKNFYVSRLPLIQRDQAVALCRKNNLNLASMDDVLTLGIAEENARVNGSTQSDFIKQAMSFEIKISAQDKKTGVIAWLDQDSFEKARGKFDMSLIENGKGMNLELGSLEELNKLLIDIKHEVVILPAFCK